MIHTSKTICEKSSIMPNYNSLAISTSEVKDGSLERKNGPNKDPYKPNTFYSCFVSRIERPVDAFLVFLHDVARRQRDDMIHLLIDPSRVI